MTDLTHIDSHGNAIMVDVSNKDRTERIASAMGSIYMLPKTLALINNQNIKKGDVLSIAQLAGIMATKRTSDLIPLCHPLSLTSVKLELTIDEERSAIDIISTCKLIGQTGVEMEALTAVSIAALTVYDMCKAVDRGMRIDDIHLTYKAGGKSGEFKSV
jgi:cyclic pyranopterin phosphate synthase|tara:strand:+ start:96 stop:572 length:477 start_codon:yes stop_codon:yes gene_type:complete